MNKYVMATMIRYYVTSTLCNLRTTIPGDGIS